MNNEINVVNPPSIFRRLFNVWYRHYRVYTKNIFSNGIPVFLEPLILLLAMGLGFQKSLGQMEGINYINFIASSIIATASMFTASFECTFGTFIRLEFDKTYDGMLSAPIKYKDLLLGEILFCGTKGLFFSYCILIVINAFGLVSMPAALLAPIGGFLAAIMFSALSLLITSFVTNINHFNFYFSGLLTPLFFFSGTLFPVSYLPGKIKFLAYILPLSHPVNIVRAFCLNKFYFDLIYDLIYIILFIMIVGFFAIKRLKKKLVS
jgi:lipooligosaccharide transport system permease protein